MPAKLKTKPVPWKKLLSNRHGFFPGKKKLSAQEKRNEAILSANATYPDRYHYTDSFLERHKNEINVFADVGCGLMIGAPTTLQTKKRLGKKTEVIAVDLFEPTRGRSKLKEEKVKTRIHDIVGGKLPVQCDAIRFANVSQHMTQSDVRRALRNIWHSLRQGGFLIGASHSSQFVLRKTARGWEEVILD